jgi:apolipoprotein N-acyltransferase
MREEVKLRRRRQRTRNDPKHGVTPDDAQQPLFPDTWRPSRVLQRPFVATLIGMLLYWASFPPVGWSFLGWLAPIPWIALITTEKLSGSRPYLSIWLATSCGWLAILQGVRLPFWALYFGWFFLSAYVALYVPLFIALTRVAYHRLGVPLLIAAPIVWGALECLRGHYPVSFAVALLAHTQVRFPHLIQLADIAGAVTLSVVMMIAATALTGLLTPAARPGRWAAVALAVAVVATTLGYGQWRLQTAPHADSVGKVALLQGTYNTVFGNDPQLWAKKTFVQYFRLAWRASRENADLDVMIWPESTFSAGNPELCVVGSPKVPAEAMINQAKYERWLDDRVAVFRSRVTDVARELNSPSTPNDTDRNIILIAGTGSEFLSETSRYIHNSALLIQPDGTISDRYAKMHRVLFGEFVPLADQFDWIRRITPIEGIQAGREPSAFHVGAMTLMPNICFESTVPQLIRGQLATLERRGEQIDAIVNMSNDGWFGGSSILDLHMACGVFRAVENRLPFLTAANPGLTYACDGCGRIEQLLQREEEGILVIDVRPDGRWTLFQFWGDIPWAMTSLIMFAMAFAGRIRHRQRQDSLANPG